MFEIVFTIASLFQTYIFIYLVPVFTKKKQREEKYFLDVVSFLS